jgi:hypothetical protein
MYQETRESDGLEEKSAEHENETSQMGVSEDLAQVGDIVDREGVTAGPNTKALIIEGDLYVLDVATRQVSTVLTHQQVLAHLEAIIANETYERWSDERYIDEQTRPLPMKVSPYDPPSLLRMEPPLRADLIQILKRREESRFVILGDPGVGKTAALERLTWIIAKRSLENPEQLVIPIFAPLSLYEGEKNLLPSLRAALNRHGVLRLSLENTEALLAAFPCVVLLDGLNEMGSFGEEGLKTVVNMMQLYPQHRYYLTCRTQRYKHYERALSRVQELLLLELEDTHAEAYLMRQLGNEKGMALYWKVWQNEQLRNMSRNPLLLFMIKETGLSKELPTSRAQLLANFVSNPRLLGRMEDSTTRRGAHSTLENLAWRMQEQRTLNYGIDPTFEVLEECRRGLEYDTQDMFNALKRIELLVPVGEDKVRMPHRMLQEYFAAQALRNTPDAEELVFNLARSEWRREELVLYLWLSKDQALMPLLLKLMEDPEVDLGVRIGAGDVLGEQDDPRLGEMVSVPAGEFKMGVGAHDIYLDEFWIGRYPVTNQEYGRFIEAGGYSERKYWTEAGWRWLLAKRKQPWWLERKHKDKPEYWDDHRFNRPNYPAVGVTWYEAVAYCHWLTTACPPRRSGRRRREAAMMNDSGPGATSSMKARRMSNGRSAPPPR